MSVGPLAVLAAPPAVVLAEAASSGFDPYSLIGTVLTPVIVVTLLLFGKLHTESDYQRLLDDRNSEKAERIQLQSVVNERVIPGMARQTLINEAVLAALPQVENEVRLRAARERGSE